MDPMHSHMPPHPMRPPHPPPPPPPMQGAPMHPPMGAPPMQPPIHHPPMHPPMPPINSHMHEPSIHHHQHHHYPNPFPPGTVPAASLGMMHHGMGGMGMMHHGMGGMGMMHHGMGMMPHGMGMGMMHHGMGMGMGMGMMPHGYHHMPPIAVLPVQTAAPAAPTVATLPAGTTHSTGTHAVQAVNHQEPTTINVQAAPAVPPARSVSQPTAVLEVRAA